MKPKLGTSIASLLVVTALIAGMASRDEPAAGAAAKESKATNVSSLEWMSGSWQGRIGGGTFVETWGKPDAGAMIGMSQSGSESQGRMYEMMAIEDGSNGPVLYMRHMGAKLQAIMHEGAMTLPLTDSGEKLAVFQEASGDEPTRITYQRKSEDTMTARVEHVKDGKARGFEIEFKRLKS